MSATLHLDLETYSETPITNGAHRYAEDAEVLLVAFAWDTDPVTVWDMTEGLRDLRDVQSLIDRADRVVIHNSAFDRTVLRHRGVELPVERVHDTMVQALAHSLPASLGMLCDVLGVPTDKAKDKEGKKLIQLFTKPRPKNVKLRRATRDTHPTEWAAFVEYARLDVDAMRYVHAALPTWNTSHFERELWELDQRINDRGVAIDLDLAASALRAFQRASGTLAAAATAATDGIVRSTTQRAVLLKHLEEEHGFVVPDLTKDTVAGLLKGDLPQPVRLLLENRAQAAATSPAKYKVLLKATSSDSRLRGTLQFCGAARTGRDAGRIFQPQNLPRPSMEADEIEAGIAAMKADCEDLIFDNVSDLCASAVRGCIVAAPGCKLAVADLSNIEGRVLAWLAGETWKVQAFKDYDNGIGHDLYKITAGRILGKDPGDVTKAERQNQGKVPELSGGYGGGLGAYRKMGGEVFSTMDDEEIQNIVWAWRAAHPNTKRFWYDVENAAKAAIREPDSTTVVRDLRFGITYDRQGTQWLRIRLPSGRYLSYRKPYIDEDGRILYEGLNQYTRKWDTLDTYGGKLVENIVQAVARDVFMTGMRNAELAGYPVVLRVHDELICETPDDTHYTHATLASLMATNPSWATGLPLAAAGFETYRYKKD
jgi:DNA polymerase